MPVVNSIQYTSRTFITIINDINSDPELKDKPDWFKKMIAGIGDVLSMIENGSANQAFLRTAFTRNAVKDLLELIDYDLIAQSTSSGTLIYYLPSTITFAEVFTQAELTALSQGTVAISSKRFEPRTGKTLAAVTGTFTHANPNLYLTVGTDLATGHRVRLTTGTTLPTGLSTGTDYYVIRISATQIELATSLANAYAGSYIDLSAAGAGVGIHTWHLYSFDMTAYQQETKTSQVIGTSDGTSEWQEFDLPDKLVLAATLIVVRGGDTFTAVTSFIDSLSTDKHYKVIPKQSGQSAIRFGDGTYGEIPAAGDITVTFAVGGGSDSNIGTINRITTYSGGSANINGVSNPTVFTGGADEQALEAAKILGPLLLKARDRFVTSSDGEALALAYGGLNQVKVIRNFYGVLSAKVVGIASGGGNPGVALKAALQAYLISKTALEEMDIRVEDCTLTTVIVTVSVKLKTGYTWATILPYITIGFKMFFSETGREIYEKFLNNGINDTIDLVNVIFSTAFNKTTDVPYLQQLIDNLDYRAFGDYIEESDCYSYIQNNVKSIDYLILTSPAFPIDLDDDEITTATGSTFTITNIP